MGAFTSFFGRWFGGARALAETKGTQLAVPSTALVPGAENIGPDGALQVSTVWNCIERRANIVAGLPLFVYRLEALGDSKSLARGAPLYRLLHDSPNARMTPFEFWRAMMMNHDLRGNAYARIDRAANGDPLAMWPMPADQVEPSVLDDGAMVYAYRIGGDVAVLAEENVLHLKNLGNGTVGLSKLEFMRGTLDEAAKAQRSAATLFGNSGKPTGVLMLDHVLNQQQRQAIQERFREMQVGAAARLYVLEANMRYQQLSLSPEDQQLLETRRFTVEELCRWYDVPPVLVHHANVTTWGSAIGEIVEGFHKLTIGPLLTNLEQAVRKRVLSNAQRARFTAEFSQDALLRASAAARADLYAKYVQNGLKTRNECRQLENDAPVDDPMADRLTVQANLIPLSSMSAATSPAAGPGNGAAKTTTGEANADVQEPVAQ